MGALVTRRDGLIWQLLKDPKWKVTSSGHVLTRSLRGGTGIGPWRRAGWVSPSRNGTKLYRRVQYHGEELYEHRIVFAALNGFLDQFKTINHKNLNGLKNHPRNLELVTPGRNIQHAQEFYRRTGLSAAETKANWIRGAGGGRQSSLGEQHEMVQTSIKRT